ncbi:MAG TPA: hypothetical protein EYP10_11065, partial [Armatimonadetes bacterium]|nr:hypothetical protein [Armatimonadota bacterium]
MQLIGAHRHISHLMLLALVTTMMHVMASAQRAELVLSPARTRKLTSEQHRGHVFMERAGTFTLGRYRYIVRYCACVDKAHAPYVAPLEGYIGMPEPSRANWYHSGFLFIRINGKDIGTTPLSSMLAVESGKRAMLDMTWHHKLADVRVRFVGLPNDDKMLVEITVERKAKITSIEVFARCYPSFFTAWYKRTGARRILTPTSLIKQGERVTLPAKQNWWLVYYDEVFDVARGEGDGPCAMLFIPEDAIDITLNCGSYAVDTTVRFRPTAR